jgi:hypothetical protein
MMNNIIEATILNEKFKGEDVLLPRIGKPSDLFVYTPEENTKKLFNKHNNEFHLN